MTKNEMNNNSMNMPNTLTCEIQVIAAPVFVSGALTSDRLDLASRPDTGISRGPARRL